MPKIRLPARIKNLERLIEFVSSFANEQGFTQNRKSEIELATDEALVNIVQYAYPDNPTGMVDVSCEMDEENRFIITLSDTGIPFNPLSLPEPALADHITTREIGGLGILFIKKMVDEVKYRREDGKNILTLIIRKTWGENGKG
ncbi:MAG: ATP-binding protein [Deltaproteobacteria bacterium]|nr:ATP-binding protein [Deltaproteobacteria bacterium]MBW1862778.1 ATP-binding protein [Deltaproteobacteria bacterium]